MPPGSGARSPRGSPGHAAQGPRARPLLRADERGDSRAPLSAARHREGAHPSRTKEAAQSPRASGDGGRGATVIKGELPAPAKHEHAPLTIPVRYSPECLEGAFSEGCKTWAWEEELKNKGLKTYASLARIGFPKSFSGKIMLVVFAGTHLPLAVLVLYLLLVSPGGLGTHLGVLVALLITTLLGFVATLFALRALLAPVRLASSSLEAYLDERRKPELPIGFSDEAGKLMADVQHAVDHLDSTIRSLEGLSGTDHLTGLPNRREGEERLGEDLARAKRGGARRLTVAVVDVNNFKAINDTHGHLAGDVCLRHVALVIRRNVREGDWLARWGGDEFVLSLWDASVFASPEAVLGHINAALRRSPVRLLGGKELVLSISVGAHRYAGEDDIRELLAKADAAMYEAKREGRAWVLSD